MEINKNIAVWRGDNTPPTDYHLWEKEDGSLHTKIDKEWLQLTSPLDKSTLDRVEQSVDSHLRDTNNPHKVTKAQIGLDKVTNDAQLKRAELGVASGVASLDSTGKVPLSQLPSYASISGVLNLTSSTCISSLPSMKENELRLYIAGDSNGDYPAKNGDKYVKVNDSVKLLNFLNTDESLYVNVGDIIAVIGNNKNVLGITKVCRVIPLNDAKAGLTDGIMTKSDKATLTRLSTNVVELRDIIDTRLALKSYSESNMNNALKPGVYPWCTLGRPANSNGAYTCIVQKSFDVDWGGYYTIEQTVYGRQDELGQVYKRIIFQKNDGSDTQYGGWIRVSGGEPIIYKVDAGHINHVGGYLETTEEVYERLYSICVLSDNITIPHIFITCEEDYLYFNGRPNGCNGVSGDTIMSWMQYNGSIIIILSLYKKGGVPVFEVTYKSI